MTKLDVDVDAIDAERILGDEPERILRVLRVWLPQAGQVAVKHIRRAARAKFKRSKGPLAASVRAEVFGDEARVGPHVPYAKWVNDGTKPHLIFPRTALALAFPNARYLGPRKQGPSIGGKTVFARFVHHPGFVGHRYMEDSIDPTRQESTELLRGLLRQEAAR